MFAFLFMIITIFATNTLLENDSLLQSNRALRNALSALTESTVSRVQAPTTPDEVSKYIEGIQTACSDASPDLLNQASNGQAKDCKHILDLLADMKDAKCGFDLSAFRPHLLPPNTLVKHVCPVSCNACEATNSGMEDEIAVGSFRPLVVRFGRSCSAQRLLPLKSFRECERAAEVLRAKGVEMSDTRPVYDEQDMVYFDPPYCYIENGVLKYNSAGTNRGPCTQRDKCLCKETYG